MRVKAADAYGWQPYYLHVSIVVKSGSLNLLEPSEVAVPLLLPTTVMLLQTMKVCLLQTLHWWGPVRCLSILLTMIFAFLQQVSSVWDSPIYCY